MVYTIRRFECIILYTKWQYHLSIKKKIPVNTISNFIEKNTGFVVPVLQFSVEIFEKIMQINSFLKQKNRDEVFFIFVFYLSFQHPVKLENLFIDINNCPVKIAMCFHQYLLTFFSSIQPTIGLFLL